jgi:hypothetical protein
VAWLEDAKALTHAKGHERGGSPRGGDGHRGGARRVGRRQEPRSGRAGALGWAQGREGAGERDDEEGALSIG